MKAISFLALAWGFSATVAASGQDLETRLTDQYRDKILALRHSLKLDAQEYAADGAPMNPGEEGSWTLYGRMVVSTITVDVHQLRVEGKRALYFFDRNGNISQFKDDPKHPAENMKVIMNLPQPLSSTEEATAVLGHVFALMPEDMIDSVPSYWKGHLAKQLGVEVPKKAGSEQAGAPSQTGNTSTPQEDTKLGDPRLKHVSPPKILNKREPEFSKEAKSRGFQGIVGLNIVIDPTGRVSDISIVHPLGMGLDEKAMAAIDTWRFAPIKRNGQPIAVGVYIEVDFRLY